MNAQDYYPFGMITPGRQYTAGSHYRYGFNGKENDNEVKGEGDQQDYGMRIYDPRVGRFLSVDPLKWDYPWNSPYVFAEDDVIRSIDLDGLEKVLRSEHYNKYNKLIKVVLAGTRDKETKLPIEMNLKTATGTKLTTDEVYLIKYNYKEKQVSERGAGTVSKPLEQKAKNSPLDKETNDEALPENSGAYSITTSKGTFSSIIPNMDKREFFSNEEDVHPLDPVTVKGVTSFLNTGTTYKKNGAWVFYSGTNMKASTDFITALQKVKSATNVNQIDITVNLYYDHAFITEHIGEIKAAYLDYSSKQTGMSRDKINVTIKPVLTSNPTDQFTKSSVTVDTKQTLLKY